MPSLKKAQLNHDWTLPPDMIERDCEYDGHVRSQGIPLTDEEGLATCFKCGELFDESKEKERVREVNKKAEEQSIERML